MKCQIMFSKENKKNSSVSCLLKILPCMLNIKLFITCAVCIAHMYFSGPNYYTFLAYFILNECIRRKIHIVVFMLSCKEAPMTKSACRFFVY